MHHSPSFRLVPLSLCLLALAPEVSAVVFNFDYQLDSTGFFTAPRRAALEAAALTLTVRLTDTLAAIPAAPANDSWYGLFTHPSLPNDPTWALVNEPIPANEIIVFMGAKNLGGSTLAFSSSGLTFNGTVPDLAWRESVVQRGQVGATQSAATSTDFGPWGGSISFNSGFNWFFDTTLATENDIPGGAADFYSVAVHELGHLLGIGLAPSWQRQISGNTFVGPASKAANGGNPVPLTTEKAHWGDGVKSVRPGTLIQQDAAMDPTISLGQRKYFTDLDYAGLKDIGWQVVAVPEPAALGTLTGLLLVGWAMKRQAPAAPRA